jgi:hypothetical protein
MILVAIFASVKISKLITLAMIRTDYRKSCLNARNLNISISVKQSYTDSLVANSASHCV